MLSKYGPNNNNTHYLPGIAQKQGTTWSYFGTDGLGSTRFMLNAARNITYAANYDPYGEVMAQYLPNATPSFGFTGQMTDASGLQYLRARYYDPSTGTFLSQDPVQGMPGGPSIRWNPYIYAGGNPTSNIDPDGRCFFGLDTIACLIVAAGAAWGAGYVAHEYVYPHVQDDLPGIVNTGVRVAGGFLQYEWASRSLNAFHATGNPFHLGSAVVGAGVGIGSLATAAYSSGKTVLTAADDIAAFGWRGAVLKWTYFNAPQIGTGVIQAGCTIAELSVGSELGCDILPDVDFDDAVRSSNGVRTSARRGSAEGGRSLAMRRAWFADRPKAEYPRFLEPYRDQIQAKIPQGWLQKPAKRGGGRRWQDPNRPLGNWVRIDPGNKNLPSDYVGYNDHVHIFNNGQYISSTGKLGAADSPNAPINHVPLSEWLNWETWNRK